MQDNENTACRSCRVRPLQPGVSIGHYKTTSGTLGAIVRDIATGKPLVLSNNHVLANASRVEKARANYGDPVLQPGRFFGSEMQDSVATLLRYIPLNLEYRWTDPPVRAPLAKPNQADAAVAAISSGIEYSPEILGLGLVTGIAAAEPGMRVKKSGLATGVTEGVVTRVGVRLRIDFDRGFYGDFADQIIAEISVGGGDSGSLVLDLQNRAVGLLLASEPPIAVISPIAPILELLRVQF